MICGTRRALHPGKATDFEPGLEVDRRGGLATHELERIADLAPVEDVDVAGLPQVGLECALESQGEPLVAGLVHHICHQEPVPTFEGQGGSEEHFPHEKRDDGGDDQCGRDREPPRLFEAQPSKHAPKAGGVGSPLQSFSQFTGRLKAVARFFGQGLLNHVGKRTGNLGAQGPQRHRRGHDDAPHHLARRTLTEGGMTAQHLVQNAPRAVNIGSRVRGAAGHLFRRHIGGRADHSAVGGAGQGLFVVSRLSDPADPLRHPEVEDLETVAASHHEVGRFDVAVDDPESVCRRQRFSKLDAEIDDPLRGDDTVAQELVEAFALHELRGKKQLRLVITLGYGLTGFEQGGHTLVVDGRGESGLSKETVANLAIAGDVGSDELERYLPLEHVVARSVHHAHPARSEPPEDLEVCDSARTARPTGTVSV